MCGFKIKVKQLVVKAYGGNGGVSVFILSIVTRWRLVVIYKSLLLFRAEGPTGYAFSRHGGPHTRSDALETKTVSRAGNPPTIPTSPSRSPVIIATELSKLRKGQGMDGKMTKSSLLV